MNDYTDDLIRRAKSGDTAAAKEILEGFVGAVEENTDCQGRPHRLPSGGGTPIHESTIRYLAECFQKILDDVSADKALHVKPGKGGAPKKPRQRELTIAAEVASRIHSGGTLTQAYRAVATKYHLESSGVGKIYRANRDVAEVVSGVLAQLIKRKKLRG